MRRLANATLFLAAAALMASPGSAEGWKAGADGETVSIENPQGFVFEIGPVSGRRAVCTFRLPSGGEDRFGDKKAPSLRVDGYDPQSTVAWPDPEEPAEDGGDFMEAARRSAGVAPLISASESDVRFTCWMGLPRQTSPTRGLLRQMMDGEELVVSFTRDDDSTAEASFQLDGAGELIASTFGITERPSDTDVLQDDLLRLRVQYRGSTCYLLAGKKNRKRCLDAVNSCAQVSHDSLVSMLGCIEVE